MRELTVTQTLKEAVQEKYGSAARRVADGSAASCCGPADGSSACCGSTTESWDPITADLYEEGQTAGIPAEALLASLGCGNPTALAELHEGETVLDLGSGGGIDVLLSARRVGTTGKAYGLDMTDDMLALANENKARAGATNVEFLKGEIENIPLPDASVDVIISNCVINLSGDKRRVLAEAFRVLKPGGRFAVSDVVVRGDVPVEVRRNMELWVGCVAGALEEQEFLGLLRDVGFESASIEPTRVYKGEDAAAFLAGSGLDPEAVAVQIDGKFMGAFVRATKPEEATKHTIRAAKPDDLDGVIALLNDASLSIPGVAEHFANFLVAEREGTLVGAIGLEMRGRDAFLRSAVVTPAERGTGVGRALTERITEMARERGVETLWLLTTKADGYWKHHGYDYVSRDEIPESVKVSPQFAGACHASAVAMKRSIA